MEREPQSLIGLTNDYTPDAEGWARVATYGTHPKIRHVRGWDGAITSETYLQILDRATAEALANSVGGLWGRLRRAFASVPVYHEHPDLARVSPETVTGRGGAPVPVGAVEGLQAREDGLYIRLGLFPEGQEAVANGARLMSPLWWVEPIPGQSLERGVPCRPVRLISVGMTAHPNLKGGEPLANQATRPPGELPQETEGGSGSGPNESAHPSSHPMNQLLIGLLAAHGVTLANTASPEDCLAGVRDLIAAAKSAASALTQERAALANQVNDLQAQVGAASAAAAATQQELAGARQALAAHRSALATANVDLAIANGRVAVANRESEIQALTDAQDITAAATALHARAVAHRVAGQSAIENRRGDSSATSVQEAESQLREIISGRMHHGLSYGQAWQESQVTHPALHQVLTGARSA